MEEEFDRVTRKTWFDDVKDDMRSFDVSDDMQRIRTSSGRKLRGGVNRLTHVYLGGY